MKDNIKHIQIGEIVRVEGDMREWILVTTTHKNGTIEWEQPTLILLGKILSGINKKPYYKRNKIIVEPLPTKIFVSKKLSNIGRIQNA